MNREPNPAFRQEQIKPIEIPPATQKVIAKLWRIHDSLKKYEESTDNVNLLRKVIDRLHDAPLPAAKAWDSPEEGWLRQQAEEGIVRQDKYYYLLDCMTSEARYDDIESWSKHLQAGILKQEAEVPLPLEYEKDPAGPAPYERLRKALNILPDNPNELVGSTWVDRATRLGLIPVAEKMRYLDIFLNIREKAEFLRDEERHQQRN